MEQFKNIISNLQADAIKVVQHLSRLVMTEKISVKDMCVGVEKYMCELENLCVKSRNTLDKYGYKASASSKSRGGKALLDIAGDIELTRDGWVKITLNTLLPNCRHRISGYIGDTISRLLDNFLGELPYFEKAFMAIVEYCNSENHNALDNDNKGWKMIPNSIKGRIIEDDNQFILSIGLFTKISEEAKCEVYIMPPEDGGIFMDLFNNDTL